MKPNISIKEYFTYHPPTTEKRKANHDSINNKSLELALLIDEIVRDEECKKMALFALQQCRMFSNQGITIDELKEIKNKP